MTTAACHLEAKGEGRLMEPQPGVLIDLSRGGCPWPKDRATAAVWDARQSDMCDLPV